MAFAYIEIFRDEKEKQGHMQQALIWAVSQPFSNDVSKVNQTNMLQVMNFLREKGVDYNDTWFAIEGYQGNMMCAAAAKELSCYFVREHVEQFLLLLLFRKGRPAYKSLGLGGFFYWGSFI